jgi:hypothetical protein
MQLTSPAFKEGETIPSVYTCDGGPPAGGISPPLAIEGVPAGAKSLVLIMDDPDVPKQLHPEGVFDHWVLFNISPTILEIGEDGSAGTPGVNGRGQSSYAGPCPPPQYEPSTHRYIFTLYALDTELALRTGAGKKEVLASAEGHVLAQAALVGMYKRR